MDNDFACLEKNIIFHTEVRVANETVRVRLGPDLGERRHTWEESRHRTSDYELHIVLGGTAAVILDDEECPLGRGSAILIAPDVPHQTRSDRRSIDRFYVHFSVEEGRLKKQLCRRLTSAAVFSVDEPVMFLAGEILDEFSGENIYHEEILQALTQLLFLKVFRVFGIHMEKRGAAGTDNELERKNIIELFFRSNKATKNGEELLARELGLSVRQMIRVLQKYYGMTYQQMMTWTRMDHAAWMLRTTDAPVDIIAETLGYSSEKAFTRAFRSYYDMPPSQYRKNR